MFVLMADVPLQKIISRAARRHEVGLTWANYRKYRRYGLSVILKHASGTPAYSPPIYRDDEVDIPRVHKQWSERDIFEVESTINQFQPTGVGIDVCVAFYTVERLGARHELSISIGTD